MRTFLVIIDSPKFAVLIQIVILRVSVALGCEQVQQGGQLDLCVVEFVVEEVQHDVHI